VALGDAALPSEVWQHLPDPAGKLSPGIELLRASANSRHDESGT